jgi:dethiobiotin synthetase
VKGVFVTGTGTGVGKTVVAAAIAHTRAAEGRRVNVFKPVLSGLDEPGEPDHELLRRAAGSTQTDDQVAPHRFGPAVSPHLAAQMAGQAIDPSALLAAARVAAGDADFLVCEGVGGYLVPIAGNYLVRDLARDLALPVVVAASPELGTINHTLLTLEALRADGLEASAVVITPWPESPSEMEMSNRATIGELGSVEVLVLGALDLADPAGWPSFGIANRGRPRRDPGTARLRTPRLVGPRQGDLGGDRPRCP